MPETNLDPNAVIAVRNNAYARLFNGPTASTNVKAGILQTLFGFANLEGIIIYGMANYKPRSSFQEGKDSGCWYARIAVDEKNNHTPYVVIEERRDGLWILKKSILVQNIISIKNEVMGTDESRFYMSITVADTDLLSIETPASITF